MMDGRRHSVDVPISRTLVALKRVRSLRDPSTSSMSKFSALVENWETNSSNGIHLEFENVIHDDHNQRLKSSCSHKIMEDNANDQDLYHCLKKKNSRTLLSAMDRPVESFGLNSPGVDLVDRSGGQLDHSFVFGSKPLPGKYYCNGTDKRLCFPCVTSTDCVEGLGSCNAFIEGSIPVGNTKFTVSKQTCQYSKYTRSSKVDADDVLSTVDSPSLSNCSSLDISTTHGLALYGNEDTDVVDFGRGCKISCCWSTTPSHKERNLPDAEESPLLLAAAGQTIPSDYIDYPDDKVDMNSGNPSSFSQKFRPKSFDELVGQYAVTRSLLGAISTGLIAPFYIFHGPRGTGKTTASRIFAAALNCLSSDIEKPCGLCQECSLFFSGRCRDFKEIDCVKMNRTESIRSLTKNAELPPVASRFKVFIIDECHLLRDEAWDTIVNSFRDLSLHVVFVLITPYLDRLPRSVVSRSQRYHFPNIKEADIAKKLESVCVEEALEFDQDALELIGAKSTGSLRDAEMMLEQLSLLGKRITVSLVHKLIGVVSDDELIDLLRLAFSADISNMIKRARELMLSIGPMQLISQLANIVIDILAEKPNGGLIDAKGKLFGEHSSEAGVQQLHHALKVLTEAEIQLSTSKNQTTWLTVALLQLSSVASSLDTNNHRSNIRSLQPQDNDFCSTSSTEKSLKHIANSPCSKKESCRVGTQEESLEIVWRKATENCPSSSIRNLLKKRGKLLSICLNQGIAVAELGFSHPKYVSKAEKSWKLIAGALQSSLGCNVEIKINLVNLTSKTCIEKKKPSFNLFRCSWRKKHKSDSTKQCDSEPRHFPDIPSNGVSSMDSSNNGSQISHTCSDGKTSVKIITSDGNALSIGADALSSTLPTDLSKINQLKVDYASWGSHGNDDLCVSTGERLRYSSLTRESLPRMSNASSTCQTLFHSIEGQNNMKMSGLSNGVSETFFSDSDPCMSHRSITGYVDGSGDTKQPKEFLKSRCWRAAMFPIRKVTGLVTVQLLH